MSAEEGTEHKAKGKSRVLQVIFGCGRIGYAVAKALKGRGLDVVIVDIDEKKVELLKEEDFIASTGDVSNLDEVNKVKREGEPEAIFILSSDSEVNMKAVKNTKELLPHTYTVVRAIDPADKEE